MFTFEDLLTTIPSETYVYISMWSVANGTVFEGYIEEVPSDISGDVRMISCEAKDDTETGAALVILLK